MQGTAVLTPQTSRWSQRTLVTRLSDLIVEFARDWQLQHDLHPSFDMQLRSVIFLAAVIVQVSSGNKSTSKTSKLNGWYSCSEYTFSGTGSSDAQTAECATYSAPLCYPGVCKAPEWADQTVDIFVKRLRAADPKIATNVWLLQEGPGFASNDRRLPT
ncbi:hypothetical protein PC128_g24547 [Phytophthora cactorum]|nr:hypothetical protein PC128_g24547 [Phytophthora cactorum]